MFAYFQNRGDSKREEEEDIDSYDFGMDFEEEEYMHLAQAMNSEDFFEKQIIHRDFYNDIPDDFDDDDLD